MINKKYFTSHAFVQGNWAKDVLLTAGGNGRWKEIRVDTTAQQQQDAIRLRGPALPGLVNAHSHAFQRAIAGLTERRSAGSVRPDRTGGTLGPVDMSRAADTVDDFWSWRERMYQAANRITPQQLEATASLLYTELLRGGYTQVCEFHYLHNDIDGSAYADPAEMSLALVRAAECTGIGLTLLPTLYMRAGFADGSLRGEQRRFASTPDSIMRVVEAVRQFVSANAQTCSNISVGVAIHSLRAVAPAAIAELAAAADRQGLPVHIHIAEQMQEVADCIAHTGMRPIEWLLTHAPVDAHWNLIHATHANLDELRAIKEQDAAVVICPTTEANLGDGVFDLPGYAALGGTWSIGSDSHVGRSWPEELRLLEYAQRLVLRQRNVAARVMATQSSAEALFESALAGGTRAASVSLGGFAVGQRADFVTIDLNAPAMLGIPSTNALDALVFSSPTSGFDQVVVAGKLVADSRHTGQNFLLEPVSDPIAAEFSAAMRQLWC